MRIAFDGSTLRPGRTGVGYYTEHLLEHLVTCTSDDEWMVVSNRSVETSQPLPAHVRVSTSPWRVPRLVWMQALAPRELRRLGADVVHFTNGMMPIASSIPTVVTIHDMSLTLYPRYHPPRRVLLNRPLVNLAARRADAIITVSESARRDIVRVYGVAPSRVHVVHEAAAPGFTPVTDPGRLQRVRAAYGLAERFILYVGTIEPRKNLPMLIEAFAARRRERRSAASARVRRPVRVAVRGRRPARSTASSSRHQVRFTGYVSFEDLPALYSLAEMFVFPSVYEGFGLPVIEAMACGTPVITADVAALTEVAGGAAVHVAPLDVGGARRRARRARARSANGARTIVGAGPGARARVLVAPGRARDARRLPAGRARRSVRPTESRRPGERAASSGSPAAAARTSQRP